MITPEALAHYRQLVNECHTSEMRCRDIEELLNEIDRLGKDHAEEKSLSAHRWECQQTLERIMAKLRQENQALRAVLQPYVADDSCNCASDYCQGTCHYALSKKALAQPQGGEGGK